MREGNVFTPVCDSVHGGWHAWQRRGACVAGGMHGKGHMWQEGVHAGEMATEVGGTHPTGMHSCLP